MKIKLRLNRDENINHYDSDEIQIDLEKYVAISVATETGNAPVQACAAHAVAIRTNAYYLATHSKTISDTSPQAFRVSRDTSAYQNAREGTALTEGLVLYYGKSIAYPASFSANNGGVTTSSKERWGSARGWLIGGIIDAYDSGSKRGHGVGMSTVSARARANAGHTYQQILAFFYHDTYLHNINTGEDITLDTEPKEVDPVAVQSAKASDLVRGFKQMADEHWPYVPNGHSYKQVDCSGAFYYWYQHFGSYMYHGSNTIWRKYTTEKGKKGSIPIQPGMAVFCHHNDGKEPAQYRNDGQGNFSHIGMYVGDGLVAEAKGTSSGCCYSKLSDPKWTHVAKLKNTIYDLPVEGDDKPSQEGFPCKGKVVTASGNLNMRTGPSTSSARIMSIPRNAEVTLTGKTGDWYSVTYLGKSGYCSGQYIEVIHDDKPKEPEEPDETEAHDEEKKRTVIEAYLTADELDNLIYYMDSQGIIATINSGG